MSLDDLRNSAASSYEEEQNPPTMPIAQRRVELGRGSQFLGMTPIQRFVLALMLFILTCVLGTFCLLITESVVIF